jgi:hypothetical protein
MRPYKLKHIPTGYYYQPHKFRGSHLSKNGKIYQTNSNGLSEAIKLDREFFQVLCDSNSRVYHNTKDILTWEEASWAYKQLKAQTRLSDWIKEEI